MAGMRCGLAEGHDNDHTVLVPSGVVYEPDEPESAAPVAGRTEQQRATDAIEEAVRDAVNGRVVLADSTVDAIVAQATARILAARKPEGAAAERERIAGYKGPINSGNTVTLATVKTSTQEREKVAEIIYGCVVRCHATEYDEAVNEIDHATNRILALRSEDYLDAIRCRERYRTLLAELRGRDV